MAVDPVSSGYTPPSQSNQPKASDTLDKNGFLKMLTEQVKNQDPNSSQDPNQYFQTISAMTQVEQLINVAQDTSKQKAMGMIGKDVTYQLSDGTISGGPVTGVAFNSDKGPLLSVGDGGVAQVDSILTVSTPGAATPDMGDDDPADPTTDPTGGTDPAEGQ